MKWAGGQAHIAGQASVWGRTNSQVSCKALWELWEHNQFKSWININAFVVFSEDRDFSEASLITNSHFKRLLMQRKNQVNLEFWVCLCSLGLLILQVLWDPWVYACISHSRISPKGISCESCYRVCLLLYNQIYKLKDFRQIWCIYLEWFGGLSVLVPSWLRQIEQWSQNVINSLFCSLSSSGDFHFLVALMNIYSNSHIRDLWMNDCGRKKRVLQIKWFFNVSVFGQCGQLSNCWSVLLLLKCQCNFAESVQQSCTVLQMLCLWNGVTWKG